MNEKATNVPLTKFVETVFVPLKASDKGDNFRHITKRAILILDTLVGVPSRLEDITDANLETIRSGAVAGLEKTIRPKRLGLATRLEAIRSCAAELGFLKAPEKPEPREVIDIKPATDVSEIDPAAMTLLDLLKNHYRLERLVGKSPRSVKLYSYGIGHFSKWLNRPALVADLNTPTVVGFLQDSMDAGILSRASIEKDRTQLVALWGYAAKRGWRPEFPRILPIPVPQRLPDAWSDDDLSRIMEVCEASEKDLRGIPGRLFWPALISVIYDTAERISAMMATKREDYNSSKRCVVIRGEHRKGGKRDKSFRLRPETVARLDALHAETPGDKSLIPWRYSENYLWPLYGELLESAGLPATRRTKFHKIRRTTASNFEAAGGDATELLDHESRKTTKEHYIDPHVVNKSQPADIVPGIKKRSNGGH